MATAIVTLAGLGVAGGAELLTDGHCDHLFRYDGSWEVLVDHDDHPEFASDQVVLVVRDATFPNEGGRAMRPAGGQWDFLGVGAGGNLWLFPQATSRFLWPGYASSGSFAEYFNDDPRLGFTAPFLAVRVREVRYAGTGSGHVSIWTNQTGGATTVWVATADGIAADDTFFFSSGHAHTNIGFSALGVYQVEVEASAFLGNDGADPPTGTGLVTSDPARFTYAVGRFATWKAQYYAPHQLVDQDPADGWPEVSHALSDTDRDGAELLLEYAFNLSPVDADAVSLEAGTGTSGLPVVRVDTEGRLVMEFVRRRAGTNPQIRYQAEFTSDSESAWQPAGTEVATPIDEEWERVVVTDDAPSDPTARLRLGRVRVELE